MEPIQFPIPPVVKTVTYPGTLDEAFERFTTGIARWWPLATHSLGRAEQAVSVEFERLEVGAHLVERWRTGETAIWGTIVAVDSPHRLSFTWHVGRAPDTAQRIEVSFDPAGEGATRITLVHSGWERLGDKAAAQRENYDDGWNEVLRRFVGPDADCG